MQQLEQWSTQELSECCSATGDAPEQFFCDHKCSNTSGKLLVQASNVGDLQQAWLDDLADNFSSSKSTEPCGCATESFDSSSSSSRNSTNNNSASDSTNRSNSSSAYASSCGSGKTGSNPINSSSSSSSSSSSNSTSADSAGCSSSSGKSSRMQILWPTAELCSHSDINNSSSSNTESCDSGDAEAAAAVSTDAAGDKQRVQYAWFLLSSANLSSCALGSEMAFLPDEYKCGSFEMGVMFLPSRLAAPTDPTNVFSCDPNGPLDVGLTASLHCYCYYVHSFSLLAACSGAMRNVHTLAVKTGGQAHACFICAYLH
eukprot:10613-Heterococcus_DN1.PRE.1